MNAEKKSFQLPPVQWRTATCPVCGQPFKYLSKNRPRTCRDGDCLYKYHYQIDRERWADYQPTFFDQER
jgi:hypothetical protein